MPCPSTYTGCRVLALSEPYFPVPSPQSLAPAPSINPYLVGSVTLTTMLKLKIMYLALLRDFLDTGYRQG